MAGVDFPRGFIPIKGNARTNYYQMNATHDAIGLYDLVEMRDDGCVHRAQASSVTVIGVAAEYKAANVTGEIAVYDDPDIIMEAQVDDATVSAQTDLGLAYDIVVTAPDSFGRSQMEIDGSTQATTATLPIKITRVRSVIDSTGNSLGTNVAVECRFNQHYFKAGSVGI